MITRLLDLIPGHRVRRIVRPRLPTGNLVLTVRRGGSVEIDGPATVTLLGTDEGRAHLGFRAPLTTKVLRSELTKEPVSAG